MRSRKPEKTASERSGAIKVNAIHHVSVPVKDLERSREFYGTILGLTEIERPLSDNRGAWYRVGDHQLHLIEDDNSTFREGKEVDTQDIHFALDISSYRETRQLLHSKGFHPEADDELKRTIENPEGTAGWPQIYIIDPDRNVIELNAGSPNEA